MKKYTIIFLLICTIILSASEIEDLKFIIGLYSDQNLDIAQTEIFKFLKNYPNSEFKNEINYLKAAIFLEKEQYSKAYEIFRTLHNENIEPTLTAKIIFGLAQSEYFLGKKQAAIEHFSFYVNNYANYPNFAEANYYLAKLKFQNYSEAERYVDIAIEHQPKSKYFFLKMKIYLEQEEEKAANNILKEIIRKYEDEYRELSLVEFIDYHLVKKNYQKIVDYQNYSLAQNSQYYEDFNQSIGIAFYYLENYQDALDWLNKANTEKSSYYKALCYLKTNKKEQAKNILQELKNSKDEEIAANSFFYSTDLLKDKNEKKRMWQDFIEKYPQHQFLGAAYYEYGLILYEEGAYEEALQSLNNALTIPLNSNLRQLHWQNYREKAEFLLADCYFNLQKYSQAASLWEEFRQTFPESSFMDEVLFKLGLLNFRQDNFAIAKRFFELLLEYETDKLGQSYFYLGEIAFKNSYLNKAKENFEKALLHQADKNAVWLRIALIYLEKQNYSKALFALNNVANTQPYQFDKQMIRGSIYFTLKNYEQALAAFQEARDNVSEPEKKRTARIRIAQTLYRMQDFEKAADIYQDLAKNEPELMYQAALSAFSADNFNQAIVLFQNYLKRFPEADNVNEAKLGIADSFYNLGRYSQAVQEYRKLVSPNLQPTFMRNVLDGMKWACEQTKEAEYKTILEELQIQTPQLKELLLKEILDYEYSKQNWKSVIETAEDLEEPDLEVLTKKAAAYASLGNTKQAEAIYEELVSENPTTKVWVSWAELKLQMDKPKEAIDLYRKAALTKADEKIWLKMLELEAAYDSQYFLDDFAKFLEFAKPEGKQKAKI
ncbi:MAG: tetratricopeptide repeat protein, partial [Candidatus Cloacimonadota bacterium]|nr:tetratricopeptide repeat protein [Candidatus Cloacimonadota bacterium]